MVKLVKRLHKDEAGQDLVEYALIAALLAMGTVASFSTLAQNISSEFANIDSYLT